MTRQGVTEYALGKRSGVPQPTIHGVLSGESRNPKARTLDRLARALGISHDDLIRESPRDGLPVRDEVPTYDAEAQRLAVEIQSLPPPDRALFQGLLRRLLHPPPGTGR
jgi:transcriptional regulator with XRE-family HTH domain